MDPAWSLQPDYAEALDREGSMEGFFVALHKDTHTLFSHLNVEMSDVAYRVVASPAPMPVLRFEYSSIESSRLIPAQSILGGCKPLPSLGGTHESLFGLPINSAGAVINMEHGSNTPSQSTRSPTRNDERLVLQDIPQSPYSARTQRPIERKSVFFDCEGQDVPGIPLEIVLRGNLRTLKNAENRTILDGFGEKVSYRIRWKGYPSFSAQQNCTRTKKGQISYVPLAEIVRQVARVTQKFLDHNSRVQPTDEQWRVGPGHISAEDVVLLGIEIVSKASVQPIYQVRQRGP